MSEVTMYVDGQQWVDMDTHKALQAELSRCHELMDAVAAARRPMPAGYGMKLSSMVGNYALDALAAHREKGD